MKNLNPMPKEKVVPATLYEKLDAYIDTLQIQEHEPRRKENLIRALHEAQNIVGHLPEEIQVHVANRFYIHHAEVSGVISFYNYFTTQPKGQYRVNICMGTACYVKGADKILQEFERILGIKEGEVTNDQNFSIENLRCVGACGLAPVVMINEKVYGKMTPERVQEVLETYFVEIEQKEE
jgi:NADH-quinone oxidoreductase subunit E